MTDRCLKSRWVGALLGVCWMFFASPLLGADAKPAPPAKNGPPDPKAIKAVNDAVAALVKEAAATVKDPEVPLRDKSNYFAEHPSEDVTPDAIFQALNRSLSSDARVDAYVKWELLSALPTPFPEEMIPRALAAYHKAPEPLNHPGLDRQKLSSTLYRIGIMNKDKEGDINDEFQKVLKQYASGNDPILRYRNELYGRLPVTLETLGAGLDDLFVRAKHGVAAEDLWAQVSGGIRTWSPGAQPRQITEMIKALGQLMDTVKNDRNRPYVKVRWNDDPKHMGLGWEDQMPVPDNSIKDLMDALKETAGNPDGGLKFK